jgi:hypothetical protein
MKNSHLFWGALLISLGILVLINNFGTMNLAWTEIWKLWPFVFILWGIILLVKHPLVKTLLTVLTAVLLAVSVFASVKSLFLWVGDDVNIVFDDAEGQYETSTYSEEFSGDVRTAELNFDAGAGSFIVKGATEKLFAAVTEGYRNNYNFTTSANDTNTEIDFTMKDTKFTIGDGKMRNRVKIELNPKPLWDMNFDVGAASLNFDLSEYRTKSVVVNMGAASLNLKIGDLYEDTKVEVDAGASSINISVPETSGCEIISEVALSSKNYEGFTETEDNVYRTANFNSAAKKIYLNISTGVSSIHVDRY